MRANFIAKSPLDIIFLVLTIYRKKNPYIFKSKRYINNVCTSACTKVINSTNVTSLLMNILCSSKALYEICYRYQNVDHCYSKHNLYVFLFLSRYVYDYYCDVLSISVILLVMDGNTLHLTYYIIGVIFSIDFAPTCFRLF